MTDDGPPTRHDAAARLVLWQDELAQAAARSRAQEADVVGDLHHAARYGIQRPTQLHQRVVRRQCFELIGRRHERQTCTIECRRVNSSWVGLDLGHILCEPKIDKTYSTFFKSSKDQY